MVDVAVAHARFLRMHLLGFTVRVIAERTGVHPLVVRGLIEARRHA